MTYERISVLHLITTLDVGGAEIMLFKLLSGMDDKRFSNTVVSLTDSGPIGRRLSALGVPVYTLNMPRGRVNAAGLVRLCRLIVRLCWLIVRIRPKILQTWLYHADLLGLIFGKLAKIPNICWNIRCSYMDLDKYRSSTRWAVRLSSRFSPFPQAIITNSLEARRFHVGLGYKTKRWEVIPNGFDLEEFKPDPHAKQRLLHELGLCNNQKPQDGRKQGSDREKGKRFLVGFIARCDPMKDHRTFFEAAALLLEQGRNGHFVLAGKGVTRENKDLAPLIPQGWSDHFHLLGEREDIPGITAALDIASSVSLGEGFPNVICEAMACGVPCVVTDVGDAAFIVNNTGYVVPPRDSLALTGAWKALVDLGEERRRELGLLARKRVMDHFELSKVVKEYEDFYISLCSQPLSL